MQALVPHVAVEGDLTGICTPFGPAGDKVGKVRFVSPPAAVFKLGIIAAKARLGIFGREALHLFNRAADKCRRRKAPFSLEPFGLLHLQPGGSLTDNHIELFRSGIRHFAPAHIGDVHAGFNPVRIVDRFHGIGTA